MEKNLPKLEGVENLPKPAETKASDLPETSGENQDTSAQRYKSRAAWLEILKRDQEALIKQDEAFEHRAEQQKSPKIPPESR